MRICRECCGHLGQRWKKNRRATRGRIKEVRPTQSREGVKGGDFVPFRLPLAGSRDSVPCGVWGNAPTVPRATSMPNALNKGAGSEASLPVTLRVRRRAPKQVLPTTMLCHTKWARPHCLPAASAHNPPKNLGTTAQLGGASADVFSAICGMQISRFTASKPSKFAFASDEKSIRQPTTSFVRCYPCTNPPNMIEYPLTRGTEQWQAPILLAT